MQAIQGPARDVRAGPGEDKGAAETVKRCLRYETVREDAGMQARELRKVPELRSAWACGTR